MIVNKIIESVFLLALMVLVLISSACSKDPSLVNKDASVVEDGAASEDATVVAEDATTVDEDATADSKDIPSFSELVELIPEMFRLNKECQEEGFYMAEFEFQMLGLAYYLDRGQTAEAISGLMKLYTQLESREGLVKVPEFTDKKHELEFYLDLQNPNTGAFMDDYYPYCTYTGPTLNVLLHLDALAKEVGQPLRLKYPLKYLDEISAPEDLTALLDDLSIVGPIGANFPQTSYELAREILSFYNSKDLIERNSLYAFSPEWYQALLQWFYENQDSRTGFWGPKSAPGGELIKLDLTNTASVVKAFVDRNGNDIHDSFPLRYKHEMFSTALKVMSDPIPEDDELDEWHEWILSTSKGTYLLLRYLWNDASDENKIEATKLFKRYIEIKFEKQYIPEEGAFSFYPASQHATLDGSSGGLDILEEVGALSIEKQQRLWGGPEETCADLGNSNVTELEEKDFDSIEACGTVNSVRIYASASDAQDYIFKTIAVYYPEPTLVLDVIELVPKLKSWIETSPQSMGNWNSREYMLSELSDIPIGPVPVSKEEVPLEQLNSILNENGTLTAIGFDVLQIPRCKITYLLE